MHTYKDLQMALNYMKRWLTSLSTKHKTALKYHVSPIRLEKFKSLITYSFGEIKLKYTLSWIVGDKTRLHYYSGAYLAISSKITQCICCCCLVAKVCLTLRPHGLQPSKILCPWDFPGKNTGVGCHFLLQGVFSTQGSNPRLLHWQVNSLPLNH